MSAKSYFRGRATFLTQTVIFAVLLYCTVSGSGVFAQTDVITSESLTPFQSQEVGTASNMKNVRMLLNQSLGIKAIALAPGFTEFSLGQVSGCIVDGRTVNHAPTVCEIPVTFQPKYPGIRTAPLVITDTNGTKHAIPLTGTGFAPQAALTPGIITKIAGRGTYGFSGDGGKAINAQFYGITGLTADSAGNLYVSDYLNRRIRKIDTQGTVSTVLGPYGFPAGPRSIAVNAKGEIYFVYHASVRKLDLNGQVTNVAGSGLLAYSGDGGPAMYAGMDPQQILMDADGNLYIADYGNYRIRKVDTNGIITTVAGMGIFGHGGDGLPATQAKIGDPWSIALDADGNLYIADPYNALIRMVDTNGIMRTIAGNGTPGYDGDNGLAKNAEVEFPEKIVIDAAGNIYFVDGAGLGARIRRIDTNGAIKTIAGTALTFGQTDAGNGGPATSALLAPADLAVDAAGNLYIAAFDNDGIGKIDVSQSVVPFAPHTAGSTSPNQRVIITNTGNRHLDLGTLNVTGAAFDLLNGDPSDCSSAPSLDLGPGFSCALRITFTPTDAGTFTGSSTITDNSLNQPGTAQSIALSGSGVAP
jgi:streptogramin lyase